MTADPQHFFLDALTGADGTGAAKSRLDVPTVFPDATAAFTPISRGKKTPAPRPSATTQQPYPVPGPLTPSRVQTRTAANSMPRSASPDIPYNPWPLATTMDVAAAPMPESAIPTPPVNQPPAFQQSPSSQRPPNPQRQLNSQRPVGPQRQLNSQRPPNEQRASAYGRTISQQAVYQHQPQQAPAQQAPAQQAPAAQSAHQVPAAMMAWLPPSIAAQIPAANRPPAPPQFGSQQPQQQRPTQQFSAPPQPNFQQQQRQAQRTNRKSGGAGVFFIVLLLILVFTGVGREILDAIIDALNK